METWWTKLNGGSEWKKYFLKLKHSKQLTNSKTHLDNCFHHPGRKRRRICTLFRNKLIGALMLLSGRKPRVPPPQPRTCHHFLIFQEKTQQTQQNPEQHCCPVKTCRHLGLNQYAIVQHPPEIVSGRNSTPEIPLLKGILGKCYATGHGQVSYCI